MFDSLSTSHVLVHDLARHPEVAPLVRRVEYESASQGVHVSDAEAGLVFDNGTAMWVVDTARGARVRLYDRDRAVKMVDVASVDDGVAAVEELVEHAQWTYALGE